MSQSSLSSIGEWARPPLDRGGTVGTCDALYQGDGGFRFYLHPVVAFANHVRHARGR